MKRTMLKIFLMLMCAALIPSPFLLGNEPAVTDLMRQRSLVSNGDPARLQAVLAKARRGEPICVAAIGGSITAGGDHTKDPAHRYIQQLAKWFEGTFPGLKVRFVNAGIGATNSGYGALRVQRDVIAQQPDLVVVEYAVNDCTGMATLDESYEGVLRQLLASSTNRAVIELFFMHKDGKSAQPEQETLGRHYGLPMISFRDAVWPELQAGKLKWETIYDDVVHPNNAGHDIASELLRSFLTAALDKLPKNDRDLPAVAPVPAPMISDTFERCTMFRAADLKPLSSAGWTCVKSNVWECGSAGGRLEYEVTGTVLMLGRTIPVAAGKNVELIVDGGPPRPILRDGHNLPVAKGLAAGRHRVAVVVQPFGGTESADKVQIWWGGAAGLAGVAAESVATSKDEPGRLVVCFASKGAFTHTPGSEAGLRGLAGLLHKYGYRGTYYLKQATVRACQADLKEWREKYGDEVGWFAENCTLKSAAAELAELRELAIGQPVRSAGQLRYGKDWVEFFQKHGVESVWGRCYEQTATDGITDRGCPFGFYYARPDCFKAPNPGSGGVISVPWLSNDLNLVFRTAQQSTFTFDPNDPQDIGVATPGDDSFWVAELNEYKKQTRYNKIVPLVIQQEIEEFDFTTRKGWKESGSVIFENLLKVLKREGIQVVTVSEAVDLYKAAYPEATPPTYGLFGNIAATTPIIRNNKSLQVVTAPFTIARKAEFKCFGPTFNGFYATGRIGRTWYYYDSKGARLDEFGKNFSYFDKAGLLVFEEGNSTPARITPYSNLPDDAYKTAILPEMSRWFDTQKLIPAANVKMVKSERELRVTASTVASRSLVFSGDSLPYGVMLWGDFSAYRVPSNAPAGTKILGNEGLFIPWVLKEGENHLDLGFGVESSSIGKVSPSIAAEAPGGGGAGVK